MVIRLGTNEPNKLYVGTQEVQKIYRGSGLVWSAAPVITGDQPPSSGSGLNAPSSWSIDNERATTGDIIRLDVQSVPSESGYVVDHFEVAIKKNNTIEIEHVLGGPATDYERRHRGVSGSNTVWLRAVYVSSSDDTAFVTGEWSSPKNVSLSSGSVRVDLSASKSNLIVGEGAYLEASVYGANTLRPIHDLHYRWYVTKSGEQGSFDALPDYFTKHFDNTRTEAYGSAWAFVPQTTGSTTVYCEVRDRSGVLATESITLTTTPATDVIAASDTYVVSTSGDYSGTPSGAQRFRNLEDALSAIPHANGDALVLLRAGESFDTGGADRVDGKDLEQFMMLTYGGGDRPVVDGRLTLECDRSICNGINFKSYYDPSDPMSPPDHGEDCLKIEQVKHATVSDCRFSGHKTSLTLSNPGNTCVIANVEITDWGNFGIFQADAGEHAVVGLYVHQNPRTWRGVGKFERTPPFLADHGPFRTSRPAANRVLSKVVGFSTNSWGGDSEVQTVFRIFGMGISEAPLRTIMSECISEGAHFGLSVSSAGGGDARPTPQDIVVDKAVHITTTQPTSGLTIDFGGTTVRNVIIVQPNTEKESSTGMRQMIGLTNKAAKVGNADNKNNPITIANCTVVDLRDTNTNYKNRNFVLVDNDSNHPLQNVSIENILIHAPAMPNAPVAEAVSTTALWTPEYIGRFSWSEGIPDYSYANKPENTATFAPKSGSSAYKSATGNLIPVDDLRGTLRSGATSKGAFH